MSSRSSPHLRSHRYNDLAQVDSIFGTSGLPSCSNDGRYPMGRYTRGEPRRTESQRFKKTPIDDLKNYALVANFSAQFGAKKEAAAKGLDLDPEDSDI